MTLNHPVRRVDKLRAVRALAASFANDKPGLDVVLAEARADPGDDGLVLALIGYCDWLSINTGPVTGKPGL